MALHTLKLRCGVCGEALVFEPRGETGWGSVDVWDTAMGCITISDPAVDAHIAAHRHDGSLARKQAELSKLEADRFARYYADKV